MPVEKARERPWVEWSVQALMYPAMRLEQPIPEARTVFFRSAPMPISARMMACMMTPCPHPGHQMWGINLLLTQLKTSAFGILSHLLDLAAYR